MESVITNGLGIPTEHSHIIILIAELIENNDLTKVVFPSLHHSSIVYMLSI